MPFKSPFTKRATAEMVTEGLQLDGQHFLVTGINSGLGKETMRILTKRNAIVFGTSRTLDKAARACEGMGSNAIPVECDHMDFGSVLNCISNLKRDQVKLNGVIANAGFLSPQVELCSEGIEKQYFVNHVAHFALITRLLANGVLSNETASRIVVVSSDLHKQADVVFPPPTASCTAVGAYRTSKLANLLFAKKLAREFRSSSSCEMMATAVHPGIVNTGVARHQGVVLKSLFGLFAPLLFKSVEQGAATQVFAAVHPAGPRACRNTDYLENCTEAMPSPDANDIHLQDQLWKDTERLVRRLEGHEES